MTTVNLPTSSDPFRTFGPEGPTLGVETASYNNSEKIRNSRLKYFESQEEQPIPQHLLDLQKASNTKFYQSNNNNRRLSYIPIIGTFVGIQHLSELLSNKYVNPYKTLNIKVNNKALRIFRAIAETFSLGVLFLIPDLIATAYRALSGRNYDEADYPAGNSDDNLGFGFFD